MCSKIDFWFPRFLLAILETAKFALLFFNIINKAASVLSHARCVASFTCLSVWPLILERAASIDSSRGSSWGHYSAAVIVGPDKASIRIPPNTYPTPAQASAGGTDKLDGKIDASHIRND